MAAVEKDRPQADRSLPFYDVILAGTGGVGKTSIFLRLQYDSFSEDTAPTLDLNYFEDNRVLPNSDEVKFRLWDTAGNERYDALTRTYYAKRHAIMLVFSADQTTSSMKSLRHYIEDAIDFAPKDALYVFVCNKIDLAEDDSTSGRLGSREIKDFISQQEKELKDNDRLPPLFFQTSAKTGQGVNEALERTLAAIHAGTLKRTKGTGASRRPVGEKTKLLSDEEKDPKNACCCCIL